VVEKTRTQPIGQPATTGAGQLSPQLVLVLNCAAPLEPSVRILLDAFQEVTVGRGAQRGFVVERQRGKQHLRVTLPDDCVSTRHARFYRAKCGWWCEDEGSKNGTFLDRTRLTKASLSDQSLLEIGNSSFLFRLAEVHDVREIVRDQDLSPPSPRLATFGGALAAQFSRLEAVARSTVPLLLLGETGTGKGVVAKALHELSGRGPFVAVHLATIPDNLLSSELFGHRKGAFSGATGDHEGLVRAAHGGTLFLDELGDLPMSAQTSLLRVLQDREVLPLGATRPVPVDVRVVAATHRNLAMAIQQRSFRADLLARIEGVTLTLPSLAQRREDIGLLLRDIIRHESATPNEVKLTTLAARALLSYDWPLNIRELEKAIAAAIPLARGKALDTADLPAPVRRSLAEARVADEASPRSTSRASAFDPRDRMALEALLRDHGGNVAASARAIQKEVLFLRRWIARHGIDLAALRSARR